MAPWTQRTRSRALVAALFLAGASLAPAASPVASPAAPGCDAGISLDRPLYGAGELATVTLTGTPGTIPALLIGSHPGTTDVPGLGQLEMSLVPFPTVVVLPPFGPSGETQVTCSFDCESPILRAPCFLQVITFDPGTGQPCAISNLAVLKVTNADCGACPEAAEIDPVCGSGSFHAITLPGLGNDFVFEAGASFVEQPNGKGSFSGIVARLADPDARFLVDISFEDRVDPGDVGYPPASSPKEELCDSAYFSNGGPVHTGLWHYYETLAGKLIGLGDYEGAVLDIKGTGPSLQVGQGANGKNLEYGASCWLDVKVESHPDSGAFPNPPSGGDINIGLDGDCVDCPSAAEVDSDYAVFGGGHALWLPGVGTDFVFDGGGSFVEYADGTARLSGTLVREDDSDVRFEADVLFASRVDPDSEAYPPVDSPKHELDSSAYVDEGGPIDSSLWRYYLTTGGQLVGAGDLAGAVYELERRGPAFQVGRGANGKNVEFGASGWMAFVLVAPAGGVNLPSDVEGDFNLDLGDCPED